MTNTTAPTATRPRSAVAVEEFDALYRRADRSTSPRTWRSAFNAAEGIYVDAFNDAEEAGTLTLVDLWNFEHMERLLVAQEGHGFRHFGKTYTFTHDYA